MKLKLLISFTSFAICLLCSCSSDNIVSENASKSSSEKQTNFISLDESRKDLEGILSSINKAETRSNISKRYIVSAFSLGDSSILTRSVNSNKDSCTYLHVFNFNDDNGFAIMSGDKRFESLLALTERGHIQKNDTIDSPVLTDLLERARVNIIKLDKINEGDEITSIYGPWVNTVYIPNGLCQVKWGQSYPFWNKCPQKTDNSGELKTCYTGCVATATAQLMSIYKYPDTYNNHLYNWDKLSSCKAYYDFDSESADQISNLMKDLGESYNLDMNYGTDGSSAQFSNIQRTLSNFGYSNSGILGDYNHNIVVNELLQNHPILISGYDTELIDKEKFLGITVHTTYIYKGGHTWLMHGLLERSRTITTYKNGIEFRSSIQTEYYPLCNFGWDGFEDGYYLSELFDASRGPSFNESTRSNTENNFQYKLQILYNIRK